MLILFGLTVETAYALPRTVAVILKEKKDQCDKISLVSPFRIKDKTFGKGKYILQATDNNEVEIFEILERKTLVKNRSLEITPVINSIKLGERRYAGILKVRANKYLEITNIVASKDYVESVVGSELPPIFEDEAYKALAVLTLTRLELIGASSTRPETSIVDSTQYENYTGLQAVSPRIKSCVQAVMNKRLFHGSHQAPKVYYHSACAGGTSSAESVFGEGGRGLKYLKGVKCNYCEPSPFWKEKERNVPRQKFLALFGGKFPTVEEADPEGRPTIVAFSNRKTSGYKVWLSLGRTFGWGAVPGNKYNFSDSKDPRFVVLRSRGAGHGVGLCQWGANEQAKQGKTYREILKFYFPDCQIR